MLLVQDSKGTLRNVALKTIRGIFDQIRVYRFVRAGLALTVNAGSAVVLYLPDRYIPPRWWRPFEDVMTKLAVRSMSPQQARRSEELVRKSADAVHAALGNEADQYFYIEGLFTDPEYQGQGFGSALVNAVLDTADKAGRPTYLSAIEQNVPFYASFGFEVAARYTLGEEDPDWDLEPVLLRVMIRQRRSTEAWIDEKAALLG
ncbi:hypothetical protein BV25DRAFT_1915467 [Artomyces pyxidatus]|uniref:Uncharacterized protein n=1 Tax=Artomyces pyxidatus TaxID=48021 RepID=A0ACB8T4T9_9AGAM|nr:hypothetical protein BV25DRAFT_1915467 [Artomyces pyxidatus]